MTIHYVHDDIYGNWVLGATHPTQGRRYLHATKLLQEIAPLAGIELTVHGTREATRAELQRVHTDGYITRVLEKFDSGAWEGGPSRELASLASTLFGGTMVALEQLRAGALNAVHLPGAKHHAQANQSSGFCVFADFAGAAAALTEEGLKVAILDIDVHHGDGTENLMRTNPNVLTFSVHQTGIFPGTGWAHEDDHENHVFNRPLNAGDGDAELLAAVRDFVEQARAFGADYIMIAAGADGHREDSLGRLNYSIYGFNQAVGLVRNSFPTTPLLLGGAGGYRPDDFTPMMWVSAICALAGVGPDEVAALDLETRVRNIVAKGSEAALV